MKSILDPSFKYTKAVDTNIRKTFARVKREIVAQQKAQAVVANVIKMQLPPKEKQ